MLAAAAGAPRMPAPSRTARPSPLAVLLHQWAAVPTSSRLRPVGAMPRMPSATLAGTSLAGRPVSRISMRCDAVSATVPAKPAARPRTAFGPAPMRARYRRAEPRGIESPRHERRHHVPVDGGPHPDPLGQPARRTSPASRSRRSTRRPAQPAGPEDLTPIFPMALIEQEVSTVAGDRDPGGGARGLQALAPDAAASRAPAGARARDAGAHLLQVRGRLPRRLAQAEHRRAAGLRERAGRRAQAHDRDRRRPVGQRARAGLPPLRPGVRGLHGRLLLRPEALPPLHDADLGRHGAPLAVGGDAVRPGQRRAPHRLAGHRDLRGGRGGGAGGGHELLAGQRAQPRAPAPDGHRPGDDRPDGDGGRGARRGRGLRRRRVELRRARLPLAAAQPARGCDDALRRGRAGRLPDAHEGRVRLRLRRHRRASRRSCRCTRSATTSSRRRSTPAACATTATRRSCARSSRAGLVEARAYRQNDTFAAALRLRPQRGHHPGARAGARDPRGDRGGRGGPGGRRASA